MSRATWPSSSAVWLSPLAPFPLVQATVEVRDALVGPDCDPFAVAGTCQVAARALALGLRRQGWDAVCLPASRLGDDHLAVLASGWVLDPTAEQFGPDGPWVCRLQDLPHKEYELSPAPNWRVMPTEDGLIKLLADWGCCEETHALLSVTGLTALEGAVYELDEALTAERVAEVASE